MLRELDDDSLEICLALKVAHDALVRVSGHLLEVEDHSFILDRAPDQLESARAGNRCSTSEVDGSIFEFPALQENQFACDVASKFNCPVVLLTKLGCIESRHQLSKHGSQLVHVKVLLDVLLLLSHLRKFNNWLNTCRTETRTSVPALVSFP